MVAIKSSVFELGRDKKSGNKTSASVVEGEQRLEFVRHFLLNSTLDELESQAEISLSEALNVAFSALGDAKTAMDDCVRDSRSLSEEFEQRRLRIEALNEQNQVALDLLVNG